MIEIKNIESDFKDFISSIIIGNESSFEQINPINEAKTNSLVFANNEKFLEEALQSKASIVITKDKFTEHCSKSDKSFIFSPLPDLLVTYILQKHFYTKQKVWNKASGISASSKVFADKVGKSCYVGNHCLIEEEVEIGDQVYIGHNVVIRKGSKIGNNSVILDQSWIGENTEIGEACLIRSATSIGTDSFEAKIRGENSLGKVILQDRVETGSQVCIDKPLLGETLLQKGCKLDNLIKIGPGVNLGEHCLITAGVQIGAEAQIGSFFMIGGNSFIEPKTSICKGVLCGGMTYVNRDIKTPGSYGGNPVQPMRDYLKTLSSLALLPKIRKALKAR